MTAFIVKQAAQKKTVEGQHGPMQVIDLVLQEYGVAETTAAEWFTKAVTPLPTPGSQLEGEITPSQYGLRFKKAPAGGFTAGRGGRSPEESRRIVRQHSQHMAIRWVEFKQLRGELPGELTTPDGFRQLIDWFHKDAMEGGQS